MAGNRKLETGTRNVLVIGDSITAAGKYGVKGKPPTSYAYYLTELSKKFKLDYRFTATGYPGQNTFFIKRKLFRMNLREYDEVVILAGVNDIASGKTIKMGIGWTTNNLSEMCKYAKQKNKKVTLITVLPWAGYAGRWKSTGGRIWTRAKQKHTEKINKWIMTPPRFVDHAVDAYSMLKTSDNKLNVPSNDGLHPLPAGRKILANVIFQSAFKKRIKIAERTKPRLALR